MLFVKATKTDDKKSFVNNVDENLYLEFIITALNKR